MSLELQDRKSVEVFLCFNYLTKERHHTSEYAIKVLARSYFFSSEGNYVYQLITRARQNPETLVKLFDPNEASLAYHAIMKDQYEIKQKKKSTNQISLDL